MKKTKALVLFPLLFVTFAFSQDQPVDRVSLTFSDPSRPGFIKVGLTNGSITVKGYDGDEIIVEARTRTRRYSKGSKRNSEGLKRVAITSTGLSVEEERNRMTVSASAPSSSARRATAARMIDRAVAYLRTQQEPSGGWSTNPDGPDLPAITGLVVTGMVLLGAAAALYARRQGLSILLLDRATFPRDKVCGDALSGKSVTVLNELGLLEGVRDLPGAIISRIIFGSPADKRLEIDLRSSDLGTIPEGFVIRREIFDQFMFEQARAAADTCLEGFTVRDLVIEDGYVRGVRGRQNGGEEQTYRGQIVMGADGTNSVVARKTGLHRHESKHQVVALRQYWRNVAGLSDQIELHYVDEVMPGYFWLFPLENGTANIGIGMLHHSIKR
ncbi:FAD-dependent monooxygenase, partial [candidate division KSB1 bacterium]|nr:FAD-dependent monooxygenase [candidate division KSB1 bacterium]